MEKLFRIVLTVTLLAFSITAHAQTPQPGRNSKGPSLSDGQKKTKQGKLPRRSEIVVLEERLKYFKGKLDPNISGRSSVEYKLEKARRGLQRIDQIHGGLETTFKRAPDWWTAPFGPESKGLNPEFYPTLDYSNWAKGLMHKWIPKYKIYLNKKHGTKTTGLSAEQLRAQVWNWLVPREKAELRAKIKKFADESVRYQKSIREIEDRLAKLAKEKAALDTTIDAPPKTEDTIGQQPAGEQISETPNTAGTHYAVDDELSRTEIIKKEEAKPVETKTARRQERDTSRTPAQRAQTALACDALGGEWRSGTLAEVRQIEADWKKALSSPCGDPYICRMTRGGNSFQAYMKTLMIWQCHASFIKLSKKASKDDRKLAQEEGCAVEKTLEKMAEQIKATGYVKAGASWKPLHIDLREKWGVRDFCDTTVIEEAGGSGVKDPDSAQSTETNIGATTTSVANPDGTRTVTKTDKDGNVLSRETVVNEPASASSTVIKTGDTTTSVANPDGTRTVTKTDKDGNILSREKVR